MRNISCPECARPAEQGGRIRFAIDTADGAFEVVECAGCRLMFSFWDFDVDIQEFYDSKDYAVRNTSRSVFYRIQRFEYRRVLRKIRKLSVGACATLLDFGAGKGVFLSIAEGQGFETSGVETSLPRAEFAREQYGLTIDTHEYSAGRIFDHGFDVLTSIHVIEHIPGAASLMKELVAGNLNRDGLCVFEVPNVSSWQAAWARNRWMHLDVPRHVNHFTPEKFRSHLRAADLTILHTSYFSWHNGVIGMLQSIMGFFGYKGFIIGDIKQIKAKPWLIAPIVVLTPVAIILEGVAALFHRGGVVRCYAVRS